MISSILYWLQVVHSLCSVKQNDVLLVGTHIDKLHSDSDKAREIAKKTILPELIEELYDKPYVCHLAGVSLSFKSHLKHAIKNAAFSSATNARMKKFAI